MVSLVGCMGDEFETDRIVDDIDLTAGIALPLVNTSLTMGDILSDETDQVKYYKDADGNERIMFYQYNDSVEYVGLDDFFRVSIDPVDVPVPFIGFNVEPLLEVNIDIPFDISDATISKLELSYDLTMSGSSLAAPLAVTVAFPTANGGAGKELPFEIYNNQTASQSATKDMFEIVDGKLSALVKVRTLNGETGFGSTIGSLSLGMSNVKLSYVKGSMVENAITLDEGNYPLDFDVLEEVPGDVEFNDPKLTMLFTNATPFKALVAADMWGEVEGENNVNLNALPIELPACPANQNSINYNYILDKTNSNLIELVSKKPQNLVYGGRLVLNPESTNTDEIELYGEDRIYIGYGVEIPLDLRLTANIEVDTIDLAELDFVENLEKATLIFNSDNGFPFEAMASLEFYDEDTKSVLETINLALLKGALVNETTGIVKEKVQSVDNVVLSDEQIEKLNISEELRVRIHLQTSNYDDGQSVVFLKGNEMDIKLSIKGKVNNK